MQFVFFTSFEIDSEENTLTVKVNPEFKYLINCLSNKFTLFELEEFVGLKSSYAKGCYRQLKRFRTTGWWKVTVERFKELLDVPKSYNNAEITRSVIKPIQKELTPLFKNLEIIVERDTHKRGKPVTGYIFKFDKEIIPIKNKELGTEAKPEEGNDKPNKKETGYKCPKCGQPLVELMNKQNNTIFWGHKDGWKKDAPCSAKYNSIAEINGYAETPDRDSNNEPNTENNVIEEENVEIPGSENNNEPNPKDKDVSEEEAAAVRECISQLMEEKGVKY